MLGLGIPALQHIVIMQRHQVSGDTAGDLCLPKSSLYTSVLRTETILPYLPLISTWQSVITRFTRLPALQMH